MVQFCIRLLATTRIVIIQVVQGIQCLVQKPGSNCVSGPGTLSPSQWGCEIRKWSLLLRQDEECMDFLHRHRTLSLLRKVRTAISPEAFSEVRTNRC